MEGHIVYRNICAEFELEAPWSRWETPPQVVAGLNTWTFVQYRFIGNHFKP